MLSKPSHFKHAGYPLIYQAIADRSEDMTTSNASRLETRNVKSKRQNYVQLEATTKKCNHNILKENNYSQRTNQLIQRYIFHIVYNNKF